MLRLILLGIFAFTELGHSQTISQRLKDALPDNGERAVQILAQRDFTAVEQILEKRAAADPSARAELVALQASVAFLAGNMSLAAAHFETAAQLAPLRDSDAFTFAMSLVNLGRNQPAQDILSKLALKHPKQSLYVYWLGRLDYDQRRYQEAIKKLQIAVELDPKSARAWDSLGLAFDMQGQMDQALVAFTKAVNLNREAPHPSAWPPHDLGSLYLRIDHPAEAVSALQESLRYDPKLAQAHYHLARAFEKQAHEEQAIIEYKTAINADTLSADACYSLAMLYNRLHQEDQAKAMFTEYKKRKAAQPLAGIETRHEPQ